MDRKRRIEFLAVTLSVFLSGFVLYGLIPILSNEPLIGNSKLLSVLVLGFLGGYAFSSLVAGIIFFARFIQNQVLAVKIVAAVFWPLVFAFVSYAGIFGNIPYQIYNLVKIFTYKTKQDALPYEYPQFYNCSDPQMYQQQQSQQPYQQQNFDFKENTDNHTTE